MAQALGGSFGLPHGAMNALTLPPALRFNQPVAEREVARFGDALRTDDPIGRTQELAHVGGYKRLRDQGVPENELDAVAEAAAIRPGAKANPRPATSSQISALLRSIY
jgi:alcohol dehydrogenase class IV